MWTRHIYPRDAVAEAVVWTTGIRHPLRKHMLTFWVYELFVSQEYTVLAEALRRAWDKHCLPLEGGAACMAALDATDPTHVQSALFFLLRTPALPTPFPPPTATAEVAETSEDSSGRPDDSVVPSPKKWTPAQRRCLWEAVQDAKAHQRTERLYCLLGGLPPSVACQYMGWNGIAAAAAGIQHQLVVHGYVWPWRGYAVDLAKPCDRPVWPPVSEGRRSARRFALPKHLITDPLVPLPQGLATGCRVWKQMLDASDARTFYTASFPDDIPDEWSLQEIQKSHTHVEQCVSSL